MSNKYKVNIRQFSESERVNDLEEEEKRKHWNDAQIYIKKVNLYWKSILNPHKIIVIPYKIQIYFFHQCF
jgi:hypothetical protein